jgi:hypothetical protein
VARRRDGTGRFGPRDETSWRSSASRSWARTAGTSSRSSRSTSRSTGDPPPPPPPPGPSNTHTRARAHTHTCALTPAHTPAHTPTHTAPPHWQERTRSARRRTPSAWPDPPRRFSIFNSFVTVLLLTSFLATILLRILKNDFSRRATPLWHRMGPTSREEAMRARSHARQRAPTARAHTRRAHARARTHDSPHGTRALRAHSLKAGRPPARPPARRQCSALAVLPLGEIR